MKKQNITIQHRKEIKMYIKPEIIKLTNEQILSYIKAYADSSFYVLFKITEYSTNILRIWRR